MTSAGEMMFDGTRAGTRPSDYANVATYVIVHLSTTQV